MTFGVDKAADFRAAGIRESLDDAGFPVSFTLQSPLGERAVQLNVGGRHNVRNALRRGGCGSAGGRHTR